ncbi:hypothetical protein [Kibdelosporangium aridum]|uniref:hypothetical protein n=1 Tax=Kibdelosporangium aridum TaxID=2030 RepID=UPI0035E691DD
MRIDLTPIDSPQWIPPPRRTWTDEQWEHLRHGMAARRMEDKWRSYVVGQRLFLHRSWTGKGDLRGRVRPR